jgi:hypothetical protein
MCPDGLVYTSGINSNESHRFLEIMVTVFAVKEELTLQQQITRPNWTWCLHIDCTPRDSLSRVSNREVLSSRI